MTTAALNDFQEIERDIVDLEHREHQRLSGEGRRQIKAVIAKTGTLQKQLAPILSPFSPEAAGERIVAQMQEAAGGGLVGC
jgi:hypothetical protein